MTTTSPLRLSFDAAKCDGLGMCSLVFPEGISLDPWGFAHLDLDAIPGALEPKARRAVACCPRQALSLSKGAPSQHASSTIATPSHSSWRDQK